MKTPASFLLAGALTLAVTASLAQTSAATAPAATDNQPAPLIMLVPVEISNKALEAGCDAYITKPIDYAQVEDTVKRLLARKS